MKAAIKENWVDFPDRIDNRACISLLTQLEVNLVTEKNDDLTIQWRKSDNEWLRA